MAKTPQRKSQLRELALHYAIGLSDEPNTTPSQALQFGSAIRKKPLNTILSEADKIYEWLLK